MRTLRQKAFGGTLSLTCLLLPSGLIAQAIPDEMAELKRTTEAMQSAVEALRAQLGALEADNEALRNQNRTLSNRVTILEAEKAEPAPRPRGQVTSGVAIPKLKGPETTGEEVRDPKVQGIPSTPSEAKQVARSDVPADTPASTLPDASSTTVRDRGDTELERRVTEMETAISGQEAATRSIIRDSLNSTGSNINGIVGFGGNLEFSGGSSSEFGEPAEGFLSLTTADLEFDVVPSEWVLGRFVLQFEEGANLLAQPGDSFGNPLSRITIDDAFVTVGNPELLPPFLTVGQLTLPFGISTGDPVADILTIEDPLTIEAFEQRQLAFGLGVAFPTPEASPPSPPVTVPRVQPQVLNPLLSSLFRTFGYSPPDLPPPSTNLSTGVQAVPPFNAGVYLYDGETFDGPSATAFAPGNHIDATMGYRVSGHCGRPYDQINQWDFCPWTLDVDVDFNSSVFDSLFLRDEYSPFLDQIGIVPGFAVSVKTSLGPVALVGEWNGAISSASFTDDSGDRVDIRPSAWQVSAAYQFDWNPWIESIGSQGTFLAFAYSESEDLAGATVDDNGEPTRVGSLPRRRITFNASEWVLDNLKIASEFSRNWDYSVGAGGTGDAADTISGTLTFVW